MIDKPTSPDTWWTALRWRIALNIVGRAMWIAPAGTARDRWGEYQRVWSDECRDAWAQRYPESDVARTATRTPPWNLPESHPDNLLIEIAILKQSVGVLSKQIEILMREHANGN